MGTMLFTSLHVTTVISQNIYHVMSAREATAADLRIAAIVTDITSLHFKLLATCLRKENIYSTVQTFWAGAKTRCKVRMLEKKTLYIYIYFHFNCLFF